LRKCPFCGCTAYIDYYDHSYTATCGNCFAELGKFEDKEDYIKAWNNRPIEDEKDREIEKLKEVLVKIKALSTAHVGSLVLYQQEMKVINGYCKTALSKDTDVPANDTDNY
jgi:hypothetical protein